MKKVGGGRSNQKNYSDSLTFMTDRCSPARAVLKLEQILVQELVISQAKKFQEKKFSSKVRIVLARIAQLRKSMLRLLIWGKTATNNEQ